MKRKRTTLTLLAILFCMVCLAVMLFALYQSSQPQVRFIPPQFDPDAVQGVPDLTPEEGYSGLDAGTYSFSLSGMLVLENDQTDVWLTNDNTNENVWLKVVMKDLQDNKIGETGLIRPGEYVQSMTLTAPPAETCDIKLVVMGYEPETYYSLGNVTLLTTLEVSAQK